MSGLDYKVVRADDWAGIYVNGELYYEGHSIPDYVWIELLEDELVDRRVDCSDIESSHAYLVIEDYGRCPPHWPDEVE